ncbi:MAG: hypothetical protein JSS02_08625 [Planctomycetes bacterium]|nr:hypothetical protein [Planctomycetota bacterium]
MNEELLVEKLRKLEALFAGAASDGERAAAANAIDRIRDRLRAFQAVEPPVEYKFSMTDEWSRRLFVALLRRYGLVPYRYSGQRRTTVMARVPSRFVDEVLWPEFTELNRELLRYLAQVTERVISTSVFADSSEAEERPAAAKSLPSPQDHHGT